MCVCVWMSEWWYNTFVPHFFCPSQPLSQCSIKVILSVGLYSFVLYIFSYNFCDLRNILVVTLLWYPHHFLCVRSVCMYMVLTALANYNFICIHIFHNAYKCMCTKRPKLLFDMFKNCCVYSHYSCIVKIK